MNHDPVFAARLADIRLTMADYRHRRRRLLAASRGYQLADARAQARLVERMLANPAGPHRIEMGAGRATVFAGLETNGGRPQSRRGTCASGLGSKSREEN